MTFTSTTIRKLRALKLDDATFEAVLAIFEEAREVKKKGGAADRAARGTRLPENWTLPDDWKAWAVRLGLRPQEAVREAAGFKSYWLNAVGSKGIKLKWDLTWQTWCRRTLERAGRPMNDPDAAPGSAAPTVGPESFSDDTWRAIAKRFKATGQWNSDWGAPPDRMDCKMPEAYL